MQELIDLWEAAVKLVEDARPREAAGFGPVYEVDQRDMIGLGVALDASKHLIDLSRSAMTTTCSGCGAIYDKSDDSRHECDHE